MLSFETASRVGNAANLIFIGSLVIGVLSTYAIVKTASIKEWYWDKSREESTMKIAEANARALEAQLALEKFKAPRTLNASQQAKIVEKLKLFAGTKFDAAVISSDPEAAAFLETIESLLRVAKWEQQDWKGGDMVYQRAGQSTVGLINTQGLVIQIHNANKEKIDRIKVLADSFVAEGVSARAEMGAGLPSENVGAVHILIGKKI